MYMSGAMTGMVVTIIQTAYVIILRDPPRAFTASCVAVAVTPSATIAVLQIVVAPKQTTAPNLAGFDL